MSLTISKSDPRNVADALISDFKNGIHKTPKELAETGVIQHNIVRPNKPALAELCNSNTIDPALSRIVLLDDMLEEFVIPLLPLQGFSVVFNNMPLEGTDEIGVAILPTPDRWLTIVCGGHRLRDNGELDDQYSQGQGRWVGGRFYQWRQCLR